MRSASLKPPCKGRAQAWRGEIPAVEHVRLPVGHSSSLAKARRLFKETPMGLKKHTYFSLKKVIRVHDRKIVKCKKIQRRK